MKTHLLFSTVIFCAAVASAQTPPPGTISKSPNATNEADLSQIVATNRAGQSFSPQEIQERFAELHRAVAETTPAVTAVMETYSNATTTAASKPSVVGGIAEAIGGLLNRNTNATSQATDSSTNLLGQVLRGVLNVATNSGSATPASTAPPAALQDLTALQGHLQAIGPILQRLGVSTNPAAPAGIGGTEH